MSPNNTQNATSTTQDYEQKLIALFNDLSENIEKEVKERKQKYIFSSAKKIDITIPENASEKEKKDASARLDAIKMTLNICRGQIHDCGYDVEICENIDNKEIDVKNGGKYYIRIIGRNGDYVDIDFFEYKKRSLDYQSSEYLMISEYIEKMVGVLSEKDEEAIQYIVEYLSYLYAIKQLQLKVYRKVGWANYDGLTIFKYDRIYANGEIIGKCISNISEALSVEKADEETAHFGKFIWAKQLLKVMEYSATSALIISAGISGIFRQMLPYTKETNINMNIVGKRATGKSTISHFVLSFFGNPEMLEGSFTDTENAMEVIRAERTVLPYVLDERMLKVEGESEKAKKRTMIIDIFREYEGKVKERLGKQYEDISGKRTCSPIISSSVDSMLNLVFDYGDLGQFRRFIEINLEDEKTLFESGKEAEYTELVAYSYYGYGIQILMDYIFGNKMENGVVIGELFENFNTKIKEELQQVENTSDDMTGLQASSKRFALIVVSYAMLYNALKEYLDKEAREEIEDGRLVKVEIADKTKEITDILIQNLIDKMKKVKQGINVRQNSLTFIEKFGHLLKRCGKNPDWSEEGKYIGCLYDDGEFYHVYFKKSEIYWLMLLKWEYNEEWLMNQYKKWLLAIKPGKNNKISKQTLEEVLGPLPSEDVKKFMKTHGNEGVNYFSVPATPRYDEIRVNKKEFDAVKTGKSEDNE